jgi:hypothetical protein
MRPRGTVLPTPVPRFRRSAGCRFLTARANRPCALPCDVMDWPLGRRLLRDYTKADETAETDTSQPPQG